MKIPAIIIKNLDENQLNKWNKYYKNPCNNWNRKIEEGIWCRTQEFENRGESVWKSPNDKRRRMIHYNHQYNIAFNRSKQYDLVLEKTYIWIHLNYPLNEINKFYKKINQALNYGQWKVLSKKKSLNESIECFKKNDLCFQIKQIKNQPEDIISQRTYPKNYSILEITLHSLNFQIEDDIKKKPWGVLNKGIRKKDIRGNVFVDENLDKIPDFFPAQIELGCGPSIEAGIPPLKFLHDVYYITDQNTQKFIFDIDKDKLVEKLACNTRDYYEILTKMFKSCFLAKPTIFYKILKFLCELNYCVEPIITNNFDGIPITLGLSEKFIRKYEATNLIPKINFHPRAKSLIVVGSHADRRRIQAAARREGLQVIYIDPEGYFEEGKFKEYKLESPQDGDILYRKGANQAFLDICKKLDIKMSNLKEKVAISE